MASVPENVKFTIDNAPIRLKELQGLLTDPIMKTRLDRVLEIVNSDSSQVRCPVHGQLPDITITVSAKAGNFIVKASGCCRMSEKTTTTRLQKKLNQTAYFNPTMKLVLHIQGTEQTYNFDAATIKKLEIGRSEPGIDEALSLNLQNYKGQELGVSRRHATVVWHQGALHLQDNGSSNGTFVNEIRVAPHEPFKLHDGDKIRLGQLVLEVMLVTS